MYGLRILRKSNYMHWVKKQYQRIKYAINLTTTRMCLAIHSVKGYTTRNKYILGDKSRRTNKDCVNIHYWRNAAGEENLGDYLSKVICNYYAAYWNLPQKLPPTRFRHLYAVGSIIGFSYQNAVVWGSGLLNEYKPYIDAARKSHLDIRCVRGPKTSSVLLNAGIPCPSVYGDPAVLMPLIFSPDKCKKRHRVSVIRHYMDTAGIMEDRRNPCVHSIRIQTTDYRNVISEIAQSERVISSSLHGLILSEAYGVPAVYLRTGDMFKFEDYYYSTGRYDIKYVSSVQEGMHCDTMKVPDLREMQRTLIESFPRDIWT